MKKLLSILLIPLFLFAQGCGEGYDNVTETEKTTEIITTETEEEETEPVQTDKYELSEKGNRYYFSADGSDANSGKDEGSPWKSFSKLDKVKLEPGDRVLLRRGDVFCERLTVRGSGTPDEWIYIGGYGGKTEMPVIKLNGARDDIAILCDDKSDGLNYIWIDGLQICDSMLGVYFRFDQSKDNRGLRVTNCRFKNINCNELMTEALTDLSYLGAKKAGLDGSGGAYEFIWPTAVNIGGRPKLPLASVEINGVCAPSTVVSDIVVEDCDFDSCVIAIGANCYNYHYGIGENQFRAYTENWRVSNVRAENTMTMFNFDACTFGYDGTEDSEYGIFDNVICDGGMKDHTMSFGTTLALFSSCCDLYIKNSRFGGCRNNGQPDGCGFDFERDDHNITLDHCVIDNNEGQGVLVMDTVMNDQVSKKDVHTPNTNCKIINCLFYNNMTNVYNENYRYDVLVFNSENENFTVSGNTFYYREYTKGGAEVKINRSGSKQSPVGAVRRGVTVENNTLYKYEKSEDMPQLSDLLLDFFTN